MITPILRDLIKLNATAYKLDPALVSAIVMQETAGNVWLTRFEKNWQYWANATDYAKANGVSVGTELNLQATSWGPMQIMGAVAREMGFGFELTRLTDPSYAMVYSCKKLALILSKWPAEDDAISAWNGGTPRRGPDGKYSNQNYVDGVHRFLQSFRPTTLDVPPSAT